MKNVVTILFLFLAQQVFSQSTDQQLAQLYYTNGEYDKALTYYEKLYDSDRSKLYFIRYLDCLKQTGDYKTAEKITKKQINAEPYDMEYKVMLAQLYEETNENDKALKIYHELIDDMRPSATDVIDLYTIFKGSGKNDLALETLEKGRKLLKNNYPLNIQFAELYGATGQTEKMIGEYLDLMDYYPGYMNSLQTILSRQLDLSREDSKEYDLLKNGLLQRIQKHPEETAYTDMLTWLFIQRKNFNGALVQLQATDKRLNENGRRVMELGKICIENKEYETARKAFKYVTALGQDKPYFYEAENALLNTRFLEITTYRNYTQEELNETVNEYKTVLQRVGNRRTSVPIMLELAHIQAFYANQADDAIQLLDNALKIQGITDMQRAEIKMELADINVLHGDIWEASILYMQIDNDFKFEPIGHEAKFKNARIFYYDGEFDFAQSQLDILKESTSKLIANDALKLSVMITDNYGLDSNFQAMYWFAQGDLLIEQHQYDKAFQYFDSIIQEYPYHSLGDEIMLKKAHAMELQGKWSEAIADLEELLKYYGDDILADDALFELGDIYENHLNDKEKAAEYYKTILFDHKGSLYGTEARKRFRAIRGDKTESDDL